MRNFVKIVVPFIPSFMSIWGGITMLVGLHRFFPKENISALNIVLLIITGISIVFIALILIFIVSKTAQMRFSGNSLTQEIEKLTQQMHYFRDIADILLRSRVWSPGLPEYMDQEFSNLNYFLVKEFYKGRSKLALEYIEEKDRYGETEVLYLETKALLLNDPTKSNVNSYMNPREYDVRILKKWDEHKVGKGWNHYFGFKYNQFKDDLDVNRIYERHQEKILKYAIQLDTVRYRNMGFSEELLSKLGAHFSEEVIPQLLNLTVKSETRVPKIVNYAFILLTLLTIFGIFQPIVILLFGLPLLFSFISISFVLMMLLFMILSIYPYISKEINK